MTYTIFHVAEYHAGAYATRFRKDVDKETAMAVMEKVRNFKNPTGKYILVSSEKENEFLAKIEMIDEKRREAWEKKMAIKEKRWEALEKAWVKGYKVTDAIEYLNTSKKETALFLNGR